MEIKTVNQTKGTRILYGETAMKKRTIIQTAEILAGNKGFVPIILPVIQFQQTFAGKVGGENQKMMFNFKDQADRDLCLAPEYTAIIQQLSKSTFKFDKDVKVFYVQECFRGEKPQAGRYRQFTQFGVEIINPSKNYENELVRLAEGIIFGVARYLGKKDEDFDANFWCNINATRGLDYYKEGEGFEIGWSGLGAQQQICGGGAYEGGIGFALGIDRLMLI